ncbi:MAG: cell division protein FtsZ [Candidatus Dojkabacteria bacterium]|nr:MAG: cell division protein FtsZ [Candidatus Dojkabacteria bacterium]
MLIKPQNQNLSARIIICGVGGAGCNAVNSMIQSGEIQGVEFIAVNTDAQVLERSLASITVTIGGELTKGLGAGGNPQIGKQAAEDSVDQLNELLAGADMVFVTAGMGGGTGTGAAPVIAGIAKGLGALTVGVVTKPFAFEGPRKMEFALKGIEELRSKVDALIVIPNQKILDIVDRSVSFAEAMQKSDEVLKNAIKSISDIITQTGQINVDFADVKAIMQNAGTALMGIGESSNPDTRAIDAARAAIQSPLLDYSIEGAKGVLITIRGSYNLSMVEVSEAVEVVKQYVDPHAQIKMGVIIEDKINDKDKDKISVTVLATGFPHEPRSQVLFSAHAAESDKSTSQKDNQSPVSNENYHGVTSPLKGPDEDDTYLDTPAFMRRRQSL